MSATVLGCGHTSHLNLFAIDVISKAPQIHLHYLTASEEYEELGYGKLELCCHGCGASTLVYYRDDNVRDSRVDIKNNFVLKHQNCPNHRYDGQCPDWRTSFDLIDIRPKGIHWFKRSMRRRRPPTKQIEMNLPPPPKPTRGKNGRTG